MRGVLENGLEGVENLSGIPGEVGASAIQNVGAYGVEASDLIHAVECFDTVNRTTRRFTNAECRFGYRDSIFKHELKGRFIVLRVSYRLRPGTTARHLEYGSLRDLADRLGHAPSTSELAEEVIRIRNTKLPDPDSIGSAGSFFKNPVVSTGLHREIERVSGESVPCHRVDGDNVKLSAAWLIDHAGMKGHREGSCCLRSAAARDSQQWQRLIRRCGQGLPKLSARLSATSFLSACSRK